MLTVALVVDTSSRMWVAVGGTISIVVAVDSTSGIAKLRGYIGFEFDILFTLYLFLMRSFKTK